MKGIDIAKWNPVSDYKAVSEQVDFAVIKIINKQNSEDGLFSTHLAGCRKHNIPLFGVYNYSYAETVEKAKTDANAVISTLKKHDLKTIVWMDVEENTIAQKLGKKLADVIKAYKNTIEAAGYTFGVYTGLSYYNSFIRPYLNTIGNNTNFWIARYPISSAYTISMDPPANKKPVVYGMMAWQYSSKGQINGIKGNVDLDITELSMAEWEAKIGGKVVVEDDVDDILTPTLRKGDQNEYVRQWQERLNKNGYDCGKSGADGKFGSDTEKAVVRWQQDHGIEAGYIGPQTWNTI